jgi:WD40 repeat protein
VLRGHKDTLSWLAFSPDGKLLASASWDETVRVWDAEGGREIHRLAHAGRPYGVAFSPDGTVLAVLFSVPSRSESAVYFCDPRTGKELRALPFVPQASGPLQFSPDGKVLAVGGNGEVHLRDPLTGKEVRRIDCQWLYALSPDGRTLVARDGHGAAHLWDVSTGRRRYAFGGAEQVRPFVLSPDGRLLVRATKKNEIQLWEMATGQERLRWPGHEDEVTCAAFSPDGRSLYTGSLDTAILCWDVAGLGRRPPGTLSAREARSLWDDLCGEDAVRAGRAVALLAAAPREALPLVRRDVRSAVAADAKRLARLVAQLDHNLFEIRQGAMRELEEQGELAEPVLRDTLAAQPSPEVRRRAEELLEKLEAPLRASGRLRDLRAVELLERVGTPEARLLLEALARGAPAARLTREAKGSVERLNPR